MPSFKNLLVMPGAQVSSGPEDKGSHSTFVRVDGLLCHSLWVMRVKKALEGLPGVYEVSFDPGMDTFAVDGASNLGQEEVRSAVLGTVVFPWLRSHLAGLSRFAGTSRKML